MNRNLHSTRITGQHLCAVLVLCAWSCGLIACAPGAPEVFALPQLTSVDAGTTPDGRHYRIATRHYVVAHAPDNPAAVTALVTRYLDDSAAVTEPGDDTSVVHLLYRETRFTPRDYAEYSDGYFAHDRIDDHARDLLVMVRSRPGQAAREFEFLPPDALP